MVHAELVLLGGGESLYRCWQQQQQQQQQKEAPWIVEPEKDDAAMAFFSHVLSPHDSAISTVPPARRPNFFSLLYAALVTSRQRQADREIARYLELSGGKLTDHAEREIEAIFLSRPPWL